MEKKCQEWNLSLSEMRLRFMSAISKKQKVLKVPLSNLWAFNFLLNRSIVV